MLKVGLTGGIGAGKTACGLIFEALGIPIYNSDFRAKILMTENAGVVEAITTLFGPESYLKDGSLNRPHLASIIFKDKDLLNKMNSIVHPAVRDDFSNWCLNQTDVPYIMQESALLFETGSYHFFDKVIVVYADNEIRIKRVIDRDGVTKINVLDRINKQLPQKGKIEKADYTINNSGKRSIVKQVVNIHLAILNSTHVNRA